MMNLINLSRRAILGSAVAASFAPALAAPQGGRFTHSVASGDPLARRVILWTRYVPKPIEAMSARQVALVTWEMSRTADFAVIAKKGVARTSEARDFCVKVDVGGLSPNTRYYYRFAADGIMSPVGQTRTLPAGVTDKVTLAVFSCTNLPFGYFQAYRDAVARGDVDVAVHLGDYIYEYQRGSYPSVKDAMADRVIEPATEVIALGDYRARYASYRTDPDLQEIHRLLPFILVWDDHELTNDAWRGGAENHQPETEGPWDKRRAAAVQVYKEWMPVREQKGDIIYRRFDFGTLASLIMLDTRLIGRDEQLNYRKDLKIPDVAPRPEDIKTAAAAFRKKWADPNRTLLGATQESWLTAQVRDSAAKNIPWQVIGQQIQVGFLKAPKELPKYLPADAPEWLRSRVVMSSLMAEQGLPSNLDAWAGYPAARDRLIETLARDANNSLILAGDTHNAWLFEIGAQDNGRVAAVELGGQSVSSPGYESSIKIPADQTAQLLLTENDELKWCNTSQRGYMVVTLTPAVATSEWIFLGNIRDKTTGVAARHKVEIAATPGRGTARATTV